MQQGGGHGQLQTSSAVYAVLPLVKKLRVSVSHKLPSKPALHKQTGALFSIWQVALGEHKGLRVSHDKKVSQLSPPKPSGQLHSPVVQ